MNSSKSKRIEEFQKAYIHTVETVFGDYVRKVAVSHFEIVYEDKDFERWAAKAVGTFPDMNPEEIAKNLQSIHSTTTIIGKELKRDINNAISKYVGSLFLEFNV